MDTSIQRIVVPEHQRMNTINQTFGLLWPLYVEPLIFFLADSLAPRYNGGLWTFYSLILPEDEAGFYMAPDIDANFDVVCIGNGWDGTLSADALGITCCLIAYSQLSFSKREALGSLMAQHYHRLRAFMLDHPEAQAILGATD